MKSTPVQNLAKRILYTLDTQGYIKVEGNNLEEFRQNIQSARELVAEKIQEFIEAQR